ncbi:ribosome silencing factor [Schaalia sp. 19OD2882]|nr:ribosome silencing factor [Schaalia sp. 19OD2882]
MPCTEQTLDLARLVARAADDKLATDPVLVDVSERLALAEAFVVVSASNTRQVRAIAEEIMDMVAAERHMRPARIEGRTEARWILLDYQDLVVHILLDEDRDHYRLESLWGDCPVTPLALPSRGREALLGAGA